MGCYDGPIPVNEEERLVIWRWAKANGIDDGLPIEKVSEAINTHFFSGEARPEWITDILSGRKTPLRKISQDALRAQYNRRTIVAQAEQLSREAQLGPVGKVLRNLWELPRSVAVAGHFAVFPFSHAGDLVFRPEDWGIFVKGVMNTYHGSFSEAHAEKMLQNIEGRKLYPLAEQLAGLDVGPGSHPVGILTKFLSSKMSERSWKMLTVMRYELWESQMKRWLKKGMTEEEELDVAKNLATWANHATGSGKGPIAQYGRNVLFGPKLTQSKLNRLTVDPFNTAKTFANWDKASPGEKAAAWTRLSGATQYLLTYVGFLAVNQGVLSYFGSKQKVNFGGLEKGKLDWDEVKKGDFLEFKGLGLEASIPGLHTEIKTLAKMLAASWASKKQLRGQGRQDVYADVLAQYGKNKLTPTIGMGLEFASRQNWRGQPLPWSDEKGTKSNPKLTWGEYLGSHAPIPLEGPIGYVYNHLKQNGASSMDAMTITKGLIITGLGFTGIHIQEEPEPTSAKSNR